MKVRTIYLPVRTRAGEITDSARWAMTNTLSLWGCIWWQSEPVTRGRDVSDIVAYPVSVMVTDKQWEKVIAEAHKLFNAQELLVVISGDGRYVAAGEKP